MFRNAFWVAIIVAAAAAIVAGFVQGSLATHPPPFAQVRNSEHHTNRQTPAFAIAALRGASQTRPSDTFAQDDVVVDRQRTASLQWQHESLAIVVGLCGQSIPIESGFLRLKFPLAFVIDPSGIAAAQFAQLVRANGDALLVQLSGAPSAGKLASLHAKLGRFDGIASRNADGMAAALQGSGLIYFDERGDAAGAHDFAQRKVAVVSRDTTADNRGSEGYVGFMLQNAAAMSRRSGPIVVFIRPLPSSLAALQTFADGHDVAFVALP